MKISFLAMVLAATLPSCTFNSQGQTGDSELARVQKVPTFSWFGEWNKDVKTDVSREVASATKENPARLVLYFITNRDLGQFSAGGASGAAAYRAYVRQFSAGIGDGNALVVIEPDGMAHLPEMTATKRLERLELIQFAVDLLHRNNKHALTYIDIGHPAWLQAGAAARLLKEAGVERARGFAINVSNFQTTGSCEEYAKNIAKTLANDNITAHALIDTSRNGQGPASNGAWCNPPGRGLGRRPGWGDGKPVDYYGWVKKPWESDGTENGGIPAGQLHLTYLKELVKNANPRL